MTDPIADMLTRIRNANQNRSKEVIIPSSNMKLEIAKILKEEGFIEEFKVNNERLALSNRLAFYWQEYLIMLKYLYK